MFFGRRQRHRKSPKRSARPRFARGMARAKVPLLMHSGGSSMNVQLSAFALLSAAFSADAALAPSSSQPPDRHQSVAGWQIEDVADGEDYDPMRRAIRLRREGPDWQIDYAFVEGALSVEPSRNAHVTIGFCNEQYGNSEREG